MCIYIYTHTQQTRQDMTHKTESLLVVRARSRRTRARRIRNNNDNNNNDNKVSSIIMHSNNSNDNKNDNKHISNICKQ